MDVLLDGGTFFECPRWHGGRWWVSDFYSTTVRSFGADGGDQVEEVVVDGRPSGLGFTPDGDLLVVSMLDHRVLRRSAAGGPLVEVADLSAQVTGICNDMVVDASGVAWVGEFGFDFFAGAAFAPAVLSRVAADGTVTVAARDLAFPNGAVVTDDGSTLIVGETFASRYTAFTVAGDGTLTDRREWAALPGAFPDGCCLDARGRIWSADARSGRCLLVEEGGRVVDEVTVPGGLHAFACMLGGPERRTLLVCAAPDSDPAKRSVATEALLAVVDVDVPGAGLP